MSEGTAPGRQQGQAASIAWAVAVIVIALVGGALIFMAMRGGNDDPGAESPAVTTPAEPGAGAGDPDDSAATAPAPEVSPQTPPPDQAATTLSPEQEEFLLGLARRDEGDPLAKGDVDAPVVIIEYADYRCPYCARWSLETLPQLQGHIDDGTVRVEFRDTILFGEASEAAAVAARAAGEQDRYWEYADALYADHDNGSPEWSREDLVAFAEEVGVEDLEQFEADLDSEELRAAVAADVEEARTLGIRSTPTFLVNTLPIQGAQPASVFEQAIAVALQDAPG